ncbi:phenylacetyl-CoA ligase [Moelleriella libera RCEF 2490]|uniref:Phenylacetyl-CoA ligase n=1 Tax=Moelleriella libera RCEF 2490 TaxID=1081109 RepID=A0A162IH05_9HYPO|nr:phenylacetyl-CoA ligase [Moelleriella libera RCEF 2490]
MVFLPPASYPALPVGEFVTNPEYGRFSITRSRDPYTCGITGLSRSAAQVAERTDWLARAVAKRLSFHPNQDTEWDKVVCLYSVNTIDYVPLTHAIHRLSGIVTPASAAYSHQELAHVLRSSGSRALFTCVSLLDNALKAADATGITRDRVFLLPVPKTPSDSRLTTLDDLAAEGGSLPQLAPLKWVKGQGARQTAYLCYSSGTSGLPKAVMLSHLNVIANVVQVRLVDSVARKRLRFDTQTTLGVLPLSHIYALTLVATLAQYRGDRVVVLPQFEPDSFLRSIQQYRIEQLSVVPPMLIFLIMNKGRVSKYDLSSVRFVYSGAAPLGAEVIDGILRMFPDWHIGQGYGMTEASPVIVTTSEVDLRYGSSGCLVPGSRAKVIDAHGNEVTALDTRGELLSQSPSVVLGYLNNEKANAETFVWHDDGRWLRTGDEVLVQKSAQGTEHFVITDRIKELIKVKGHQVAPAELEAHLLSHPYVSDCAVIPILDQRAGEVPKAYVVKAPPATSADKSLSDEAVVGAITKHVRDHKAPHKWIRDVEFIDAIPKSPSGKILRKILREKEKGRRQRAGSVKL